MELPSIFSQFTVQQCENTIGYADAIVVHTPCGKSVSDIVFGDSITEIINTLGGHNCELQSEYATTEPSPSGGS